MSEYKRVFLEKRKKAYRQRLMVSGEIVVLFLRHIDAGEQLLLSRQSADSGIHYKAPKVRGVW